MLDQTLNARAITIKNGSLTSTAVPNGIVDLTVTTQLVLVEAQELLNLMSMELKLALSLVQP
jgi:hypothetical protein